MVSVGSASEKKLPESQGPHRPRRKLHWRWVKQEVANPEACGLKAPASRGPTHWGPRLGRSACGGPCRPGGLEGRVELGQQLRLLALGPAFPGGLGGTQWVGLPGPAGPGAGEEGQAGPTEPGQVPVGGLADEAVEHGVGHAVEAGEQEAEVVGVEDALGELAAGLPEAAHQQQHVVRQEAGQEDDHGAEHQPLDLVLAALLGAVAPAHGAQDALVGGQQQADGEEEAHQEAVVVDAALPRLDGVVLEAHAVLVLVLHDLLVHQEVDAGQQLFGPDAHADAHGRLQGPELVEAEGVGHSQVAVDGDAAEEAHADVDVLVEEDAAHLARQVAHVLQPKGQRADVEEVGHRQVAQVHAQLVPGLDLQVAEVEGQAVGREAHHQHRDVDHRGQRLVDGVVDGAAHRGVVCSDVPHLWAWRGLTPHGLRDRACVSTAMLFIEGGSSSTKGWASVVGETLKKACWPANSNSTRISQRPDMMAHTCISSTLGGQGGWIT
ncbi:LOW QUALITY PROTEIN: hypothetical protein AAY473_027913 [Plecturocebus cupreus]